MSPTTGISRAGWAINPNRDLLTDFSIFRSPETPYFELADGPYSRLIEKPAAFNVPVGDLLTTDRLARMRSGDAFSAVMNAAAGVELRRALGEKAHEVHIMSTAGGVWWKGRMVGPGHHAGHNELIKQVVAATVAVLLEDKNAIPIIGACIDVCDGVTQGTPAAHWSLPYRNDAFETILGLCLSRPKAGSYLFNATCDKGIPAMLMAMVSLGNTPGIFVPGGSTLAPSRLEGAPSTLGLDSGAYLSADQQNALRDGLENSGSIQSGPARAALGMMDAAKYIHAIECSLCGKPGGGCQFYGTAGTGNAMLVALGLSLIWSGLAPSGTDLWTSIGEDSAKNLLKLKENKIHVKDIFTEKAVWNAMMLHAASGGSTNWLIHLAAACNVSGLGFIPRQKEWDEVHRKVVRCVDVLPNGPINFLTPEYYAAGGTAKVLLNLLDAGLLHADAMTVHGITIGEVLEQYRESDFVKELDGYCKSLGLDPELVIRTPQKAREQGFSPTTCIPTGNLAPEGAAMKATSIKQKECAKYIKDGVFDFDGPAVIFESEEAAALDIKGLKKDGTTLPREERRVVPGCVIILRGYDRLGMPETFQITRALVDTGLINSTVFLTDARVSGVSTGQFAAHISPGAGKGGPIGRLQNGDRVRLKVNFQTNVGSIDFIGETAADGKVTYFEADQGARILETRPAPDTSKLIYPPELQAYIEEHGAGPATDISLRKFARHTTGIWDGAVPDYAVGNISNPQ